MPKTNSPIDIRKWLRLYEKGLSMAAIAKKEKRDIRTITGGIEDARHEIDARAAHVDQLKHALHSHQEDLLDEVESVKSALVVLPPRLFVWRIKNFPLDKMVFPEAKVEKTTDTTWTTTLNLEGDVKWEVFREHIKRDAFWKIFSLWKEKTAEHVVLCAELVSSASYDMRQKTELEIMERHDTAGDNYLYADGVRAIYDAAVEIAFGNSNFKDFEKRLKVNGTNLDLGEERTPILASKESMADLKNKVLEVLQDNNNLFMKKGFLESYRTLSDLTEKARREAEELALTRYLPGTCRVCRRLGVA